ncbi:hypothetical protein AB6A40_001043 [Gnathostoma spinigerum]|uniref:Uncharacterized protein n=1 Tax=Gnathostoma spinigerum TaxID=75299 RepID=A0ABD6E841_9BILA
MLINSSPRITSELIIDIFTEYADNSALPDVVIIDANDTGAKIFLETKGYKEWAPPNQVPHYGTAPRKELGIVPEVVFLRMHKYLKKGLMQLCVKIFGHCCLQIKLLISA